MSSEVVSDSSCGDTGEHFNNMYREMLVEPSLLAVMTSVDLECTEYHDKDFEDGTLITICFYGSEARSVIIERDTDNLTKEEKDKHKKELTAARTEELLRWTGFKAFHRRPRMGSQNLIDCTWVDKWEYCTGGASSRAACAREALRTWTARR